MTRLSINAAAAFWHEAGGSKQNVPDAIAIAIAESGLDTTAVSSSGDYGVWQINRIHFGTVGINANNWSDPFVNALAAYLISAKGTNWAAWCTAWVDPGPNCGHGYLPHPQPGSPAGKNLPALQVLFGVTPLFPSQLTGVDAVKSAWGELQHFLHPYAGTRYATITKTGTTAKKG